MANDPVSQRIMAFQAIMGNVLRFMVNSPYPRLAEDPEVSNFAIGNPQEMPLPGFADALKKWSTPQNKDWFAYKNSEPEARAVVAQTLRQLLGVAFEEADIFMTDGAFAAICIALCAVVDPGDEVIFISPPWFFYEALIAANGGVPVRVKINPQAFDLDLNAIEAAITRKTRAIIVNSPNNPTGKIYPPETLKGLADVLTRASERNGRTVYLLSDEAYSRIVYDGRQFHSPAEYYPNTFLMYTYGKTLLTPGQRLGYIALPPSMPNRSMMRLGVMAAQFMAGHAVPNALLQHALPDIEKLSIDVKHLQYKRDWMVKALRDIGYEVHAPEGTFYLLPRSPLEDDWAFIELLAEQKILCLPGIVVEFPGYFRISLTANDQMIEKALPGFAKARQRALETIPTRG
jgi:aspartate aminotransferase